MKVRALAKLIIKNSTNTSTYISLCSQFSTRQMMESATDISQNLQSIRSRIETASKGSNKPVRLVAVSKIKPIEDIITAYESGQRHFGENYVQELDEKAHSEIIHSKCPDIKWHLIGHLQSNKAKKVALLPNLYAVETVDSVKLANILNKSVNPDCSVKLNILIQVNTSSEEQKSGVMPDKLCETFSQIQKECVNLNILGLMTIGSYEASANPDEENPDFKKLNECRDDLCAKLGLESDSVELSMGMSHDFEQAIQMGSTNVRVGSSIFGARPKNSELN